MRDLGTLTASIPEATPTETILVAGGTPSDDSRRGPAISSDGRYLAFTSALPLVPDDTNGVQDVYLYDRGTRTLSRVSTASAGGLTLRGHQAAGVRTHRGHHGPARIRDTRAADR